MRWFLLYFTMICLSPRAVAQDKDSPMEPVVLPGHGVATPNGATGFFPSKAGGIDAIDLATGRVLWTTKDANRPLLSTGDRLFAQAPVEGKGNQIRVVVFDGDGKPLVTSEAIKLPDWAIAEWNIGGATGHSFRSASYLSGGLLLFVWEAKTWYAGGARPTPEIEEAARKNADGVTAVNIQSGKLQAPDNPKHAEAVARKIPADLPNVSRAGRIYSLQDQPIPGKAFQMQRFIRAIDATTGAALWRAEIRAPVILPPRP